MTNSDITYIAPKLEIMSSNSMSCQHQVFVPALISLSSFHINFPEFQLFYAASDLSAKSNNAMYLPKANTFSGEPIVWYFCLDGYKLKFNCIAIDDFIERWKL